jgi:hypothetical protein
LGGARQTSGVVLSGSQHEDILAILQTTTPGVPGIPTVPAATPLMLIFVFIWKMRASPWSSEQIFPVMLPGDTTDPIWLLLQNAMHIRRPGFMLSDRNRLALSASRGNADTQSEGEQPNPGGAC